MLAALLFSLTFALLNRARGSRLFETTTSTTTARIVATLGMAVLTMLAAAPETDSPQAVLLLAWAGLYLGLLPGWGEYIGFAIGVREGAAPDKEFAPVDWLMARLTIKGERLWGTVALGLRMALVAPCLIGLAYLTGGSYLWALLTPLLALPYSILGLITDPNRAWKYGEYGAGALLGLLTLLTVALP